MRVPPIQNPLRCFAVLVLLLGAALADARALEGLVGAEGRGPDSVQRIELASLGYEPQPERYLLHGGTMFTVHFVDSTHLMVTWSVRGLLKRLPDSQPNDQDRNVEAVLLELPTGKVLARTTWRMRDHANYLWPLGHGHFLLRQRNEFSVLSPVENLASGDAFALHQVLESQRVVGFVFVSPGADVLTVESLPLPREEGHQLTDSVSQTPVQINFYRVLDEPGHPVALQYAGLVRADNPVALPLTGEGYLDSVKDSPGTYNFDFVPYEGKRMELAAFDTTCFPHVVFVSRSEFVSFGCRGADDRQQLGFFNLKGEHRWLTTFSNQHINPSIISAPAAGRFALERTIVTSAGLDLENLVPAEIDGEEITAYQGEDGRPLLKVTATPVQRAGQNFDLSADGLELAVIREGNVEVYRLPELTGKDRKEVDEAAKLAPPEYKGPVRVSGDDQREAAAAEVFTPSPAPESGNMLGDPVAGQESAPRKPPSLYSSDYPRF